MKTRCDHCLGAFGLVRRRYFHHQFCCEACEKAYKQQHSSAFAEIKSGLYRSLARSVTRNKGLRPFKAAVGEPMAKKGKKAA